MTRLLIKGIVGIAIGTLCLAITPTLGLSQGNKSNLPPCRKVCQHWPDRGTICRLVCEWPEGQNTVRLANPPDNRTVLGRLPTVRPIGGDPDCPYCRFKRRR